MTSTLPSDQQLHLKKHLISDQFPNYYWTNTLQPSNLFFLLCSKQIMLFTLVMEEKSYQPVLHQTLYAMAILMKAS